MTLRLADRRLRPRKEPAQPRARETRARILGAAREVFAQHGYAAGTTNRIAEKAGMSVGSLYQYFPNKDAILVELVEEHIDEGAGRVEQAVGSCVARHAPHSPPLPALVDAAVAVMIEVHGTDRLLHRVLFEQAPRPPELLERLRSRENDLLERVVELLSRHPDVSVPDVRVASRLAVAAIESLVHLIATDEASGIADEVLRRELVRMVTLYLTDSGESCGVGQPDV